MFKKLALLVVLMLLICGSVYAEFVGPSEVLSVSYGSGEGQVGLDSGDSGDQFPRRFAASASGKIALCDEVNNRVSIYQTNGVFERNINILSTSVVFDNSDALYLEAEFRKFNNDGALEFKKDAGYDEIYSAGELIIGYDRERKNYTIYSTAGQVIKTSATRPLELGVVSEKPISESQYRITIKYPNKTYEFVTDGSFMRYVRSNDGNIDAVDIGAVSRFDWCGKKIGEMHIPKSGKETVAIPNIKLPVITDIEYGQPIVSPNGDIYTWKKTSFKYSILKWTWVDDPRTMNRCLKVKATDN